MEPLHRGQVHADSLPVLFDCVVAAFMFEHYDIAVGYNRAADNFWHIEGRFVRLKRFPRSLRDIYPNKKQSP